MKKINMNYLSLKTKSNNKNSKSLEMEDLSLNIISEEQSNRLENNDNNILSKSDSNILNSNVGSEVDVEAQKYRRKKLEMGGFI